MSVVTGQFLQKPAGNEKAVKHENLNINVLVHHVLSKFTQKRDQYDEEGKLSDILSKG